MPINSIGSISSIGNSLPRHVGIIMDGNGRWAKKRGLPRQMGHRQGAEAMVQIVKHAGKVGIEYLTLYALSTENWSRPKEELDAIMNLLRTFLNDAEKYRGENTCVKVIGDPSPLAPDMQEKITRMHAETENNTGMTLNIALNYGSRAELVRAAKELVKRCANGEIKSLDTITEADFARGLYTAGQPDVDLIIRTSGELRLSNFLLWQSAYAEYFFPEVLFPDFKPKHFDEILAEYAKRNRRMGGI